MTDNNRHVEFDDLDDSQMTLQQVRSLLTLLDADAAEVSALDLALLRSDTLNAVAQEFLATAEHTSARPAAALLPGNAQVQS